MTYDFIGIGESLRDVFYYIDEASVNCQINKDKCLLCLEYAEKIPVRHVVKVHAAGNSSNATVGAARLGLKTALVTWVGDDHAGHDVRNALKIESVDEHLLTHDKKHPTSEATILSFQGERTQLVYFQPRTYKLPTLPKTRCIYYSAMGEKHQAFDKVLVRVLERHFSTFFTFQPGTTHIRAGLEPLLPLLKRSDLFILNKDEAHHLLLDGERPLMSLFASFHHYGAKRIVITDGKNGADGFDGENHWHMPIFNGEAKDRTGAGDSFAAGVTAALMLSKPFEEALRWGTANSWNVVRHIGPQTGLLTTAQMKKVLKKFARTKAVLQKH